MPRIKRKLYVRLELASLASEVMSRVPKIGATHYGLQVLVYKSNDSARN